MPMTISGDGTITGLVAGGLPDATIQQADLASGVAGTGPAFSAYNSGAQTVASSTWTKLQCNTEIFDTNNNFDATTNYRLTPTVAGYYFVNGAFYTAVAIGQPISGIYKNGSLYQMAACGATNQGVVIPVSSLIYCNGSTDYVEFYMYQNSGSSFNTIGNRPDINYFQASLVRGA